MNKYHNKKVSYNGMVFDSKKEYNRYRYLEVMVQQGKICNLTCQKRFLLQEGYFNANGKKIRPIYYIADFVYFDLINGTTVVEDVKGVKTDVYKLKKKIFEYKYKLCIKEI